MFTNQTPNYGLPQYTSPDELNVLVDFNGAMSAIDTQMKSNELAAQDAKNTAVSANNKADANTLSIQALNSTITDPATGVGPRVTALEGRVNTIDSLIGNGVPTVGDDTLVGGINANAASIGNLANLDTTDKSSLVAAINEVAQGGGGGGEPVDADDVSYSNTQSGLNATNVQDAIDEIAQGTSAPKLVFDGTITTSSASYSFTDTVDYTHKNLLVVGTRAADTPGVQRSAGVVYTSFGMTTAYLPVVGSPSASGIISIDNITGSTFTAFTQTETAIDHLKIYEI